MPSRAEPWAATAGREAATAAAGGDPAARLDGHRLRTRLALYAAAAALLFVIERLIPNPLPWVRLGLANIVTVIVLVEHGVRAAAAVLAVRLLLGGLFAASLFGPQFALSVCGGAASLAAMALAAAAAGRGLSPLGLSLLGAAAHGTSQLALVGLLFAGRGEVLALLPLFLAIAVVTGLVTGFAADLVLARLELARATPRRDDGRAP